MTARWIISGFVLKQLNAELRCCFKRCYSGSEESSASVVGTIPRNIRVTRINDLKRVVSRHAAVMASGYLTYLMGCRGASNDSYQVCYL